MNRACSRKFCCTNGGSVNALSFASRPIALGFLLSSLAHPCTRECISFLRQLSLLFFLHLSPWSSPLFQNTRARNRCPLNSGGQLQHFPCLWSLGVIPVVPPTPCLRATSFPRVPVMKTRLSPHKESELVYSGVNMSSHGLETQV